MKRLLLLILLFCVSPVVVVWAAPALFQPADHSFKIVVSGPIHAMPPSDERFFWGSDDGERSYYFGYAIIPRAATMEEEALRGALGQFLTNYLANASVTERHRMPITSMGHVGLEATGTGNYGASWVRIVAVGPRIYVLASDGTSEEQNKAYWDSFKLGKAPKGN